MPGIGLSQNYSEADFTFKVKKVLRYIRLYGVSRTIEKIRGQYHMKADAEPDGKRWANPRCRSPDASNRNIAIVGCGNYSFSTIAYYLHKKNSSFLRCTYDPAYGRAVSLCKRYKGAYVVSDWRAILRDNQVKMVFIASNHASHAEYASAFIEAGKHVHIEKPHVVTKVQLARLLRTMKENRRARVFLGFNRPRSKLFRHLQQTLARESGALMINWFVAGHEIPDGHWYLDEGEGGRVLGNLCHWSDITLHLVTIERAFPCVIKPASPRGARSDFVVSILFADRSCATLTFFEAHTFEGVREVLNVHKGDVLATLTDFQFLSIDVFDKKEVVRMHRRDHGHAANIWNSLDGARESGVVGECREYLTATAELFLAIHRAIESGESITLSKEDATGAVYSDIA